MNLFDLFLYSKNILEINGIQSAEQEALLIISEILNISRHEVFIQKNKKILFFKVLKILSAVKKRSKKIPLAYILGYQYFYLDKFLVDKRTFIPRFDTEHIIYAITDMKLQFSKILDVCCGSGILALTLAKIFPESKVFGIDIYVKLAVKNKKKLKIKNAHFIKADFLKENLNFSGKFDLIVSNPPYLSSEDFSLLQEESKKYEPFLAFYGGEDGLKFYRRVAEFSVDFLACNGYIVLEVDHKWKKVMEIFSSFSYNESSMKVIKDYNGLERVLVIKKDFL
jgi:release factor glutamine methyltransferase